MKARNIIIWLFFFMPLQGYSMANPNFIIQSDGNYSKDKIGYLFAHGLGATQEQFRLFLPAQKDTWIINYPMVLFDFPDSKNNSMEYHHDYVNLGQDLDIERLAWSLEQAQKSLPEYKFILTGISRGSSTIINTVGFHQPSAIAALVLESPFDTVKNVIKHLLIRFHVSWIPFSKQIAHKIAKKNFPLLNLDGPVPLNLINKVSFDIPLIIIHSQRDKTIPINSSRKLYEMLVIAGHPNVYLLELASGEHGKLLEGPEGDLYRNVIHAFYRKHSLPYNVSWAQTGETMLKHCQPTLAEITKKMRKNRGIADFDEDLWNDEFEWSLDFNQEDDDFLLPTYLLI